MKFVIQHSEYQREISGLAGFPAKASNEHGPFGFGRLATAKRFAADHQMHEVEIGREYDDAKTELPPADYRD